MVVQQSHAPGQHEANERFMVSACSQCQTRHLSICAAFGTEELITLDHVVQHRTLPPKTTLFDFGQPVDAVYSISEGTVRLFRLLSDGRRQIVGFAIKGAFLGVTLPATFDLSAESIDTVRMCRIPVQTFRAMIDEKPHLLRKLHELTARELQAIQGQVILLGRRNAEERIATFLLAHRERLARFSPCSVTVPLVMSRTDIADYLGLTIETVSRTISKFAREKLIVVVPDGVRLLDIEKLNHRANEA